MDELTQDRGLQVALDMAYRPLPPLGATGHIQACSCGVWKLFGKCLPMQKCELGVCPSECLCVSRRSHPPHPPGQLQLSSPRWEATRLLCQDPVLPPKCHGFPLVLSGVSRASWGQQEAEFGPASPPLVVSVPWCEQTPPP